MTREQALDKAAQEFGFDSWQIAQLNNEYVTTAEIDDIVNRAIDLTWNAAIEAAAESAYIADDGEHIVSKQSILKLKR